MQHNRFISLGVLFCLAVCYPLSRVCAQESLPYFKTNQPAVRVELRGGEMVGAHQIRRAYMTLGTNLVGFQLPPECEIDGSNPEKLVISDLIHNCFITLSYTRQAADPSTEAGRAVYRTLALSRFPSATISGESSEFAGDHNGPAFNLLWKNSGGAAQSARVAFISLPAGVLQIELVAGTENFDHATTLLRILLASICTNERGKIEITPLPDNS